MRVLAIFCCQKKMDQRICIKFYVKNGIKCSKTLEMFKVAYCEYTVSQKIVYKWYKLLTEGREEVNDDARPRRPSTSTSNENTEAVKKILMENHQITIREVAEDVGISVGSCHAIVSDILVLKRVAAKFVPKLLNLDLLTRHCLFVIFWPKQQRNHASATVFTRFSPLWLFPVSKIEETHERTAFCHDWGDKNRIDERA